MKNIIFLFICLFICADNVQSQNSDILKDIPTTLKEWLPWVRGEIPEVDCARVNDAKNSVDVPEEENKLAHQYYCLWVGKAEFIVEPLGAKIAITAHSQKDNTKLILPYGFSLQMSDLSITKDGSPFSSFSIEKSDSELALILPKGNFEIQGRMYWDEMPSKIPLPESYALVNIVLNLEDKSMMAKREGDYISLSTKESIQAVDSIRAEVFRKIKDGSPLEIDTRIQISVSGKSRIEDFGNFLPLNSQLIKVDGSLQSYIDSSGNVKIKVSQGTFTISFLSLLKQPLTLIEFSKLKSSIWPNEEVWIWEGNSELRSVELKNVNSINGGQAHLPADWQTDSALVVNSLENVELEIKRRGEEQARANELILNRTIWPNLSSSGYTVSDQIQSLFRGTFRLNATKDLDLGRVSVNDLPTPITLDPVSNLKGIEIRDEQRVITATSRINSNSVVSATGWDHPFEKMSMTVNLPPSWELLYAKGVSSAKGTWISSWSIFDVFILTLLIIFIHQIMGVKLAVSFAAFSIIGRSQFMLPDVFFAYVIALVALLKLTSEKSSRYVIVPLYFCIGSSFIAFIIQSFSFAKLQVIQFLHPQLEGGTRYKTLVQEILNIISNAPLIWLLFLIGAAMFVLLLKWCLAANKVSTAILRSIAAMFIMLFGISALSGIGGILFYQYGNYESYNSAPAMVGQAADSSEEMYSDLSARSVKKSFSDNLIQKRTKEQDAQLKSRTIQAGPSVPNWFWKQAHMSLSGPINSNHKIELVFIKPWVQRILSGIRIVLVFTLIALLSRFLFTMLRERKEQISNIFSNANLGVLIFWSLLFLQTYNVKADFPDSSLLGDLKNKLASMNCNEQTCSSIDIIEINLKEKRFEIYLDAYSRGNSSIAVPGPIEDFQIEKVFVNQSPTTVLRIDDQFLSIKLGDGFSKVVIEGELSDKNSISIKVPQKPLRMKIDGIGWDVGAYDKGGSTDVIQVSRLSDSKVAVTKNNTSSNYNTENWISVERSFEIGDQVRAEGRITRLGDIEKEVTVFIPLKEHEQLTIADLIAKDGNILATFKPGVSSLSFSSSFGVSEKISLTADTNKSISEVWHIACDDYISCSFEGDIVPNKRLDEEGKNIYKFIPFSKEKVVVGKTVLSSAEGESLNIQNINHNIEWGDSVLSGNINIGLLTTKQSVLDISFTDPEISIQSVKLDGVEDPRAFKSGELKLLLTPESKSIEVSYRKVDFSPSFREVAPVVNLSAKAGNIKTNIRTNQPRWLVWLDDSFWGPAIFIWSKVLITFIIIFSLRKFSFLSLSTGNVILLSFALSLMPTIILPLPLLWISIVRDSKLKEFCATKIPKYLHLGLLSTLAVLSVLIVYFIIKIGLLGDPPLLVAGNSSNLLSLNWYSDFCGNGDLSCTLPAPWIISFSIAYWRGLTLLISLCLSILVVKLVKETALIVRG